MQSHLIKMRELAGVITKDWLRYQFSLQQGNDRYLRLANRLERIASGPEDLGYVCLWPHTSKLHAPMIMPDLGKKLLNKCLKKSIFHLQTSREMEEDIQISVLIGHRGIERLPLLLTTIKSIAAQIDVSLECIIIEQDNKARVKEYLPKWVRHIFLKTDSESTSYNRSAGFNLGAQNAHGRILLLHDNDMLVSSTYCKDIVTLANKGFEAINSKRYVFYLNRLHSEKIISSFVNLGSEPPDYIVQNLEAGGSMAITKEAYFRIGGMDEEFVGWGGEDIEFWKRCSLLNRWIWGYEPIIHLWHKSQPLKENKNNPNIARIKYLDAIDTNQRIKSLRNRYFGNS
jgi:hypothetical protein